MARRTNDRIWARHGSLAVIAVAVASASAWACGSSNHEFADGGGGGSSGGASGGNGEGGQTCTGSFCLPGSSSGVGISLDGSLGSSSGPTGPTAMNANGSFNAPDCANCTFPPTSASACASSAPAIQIHYPNNNVLLPPNMNSLSVQWTPYGGYQTYEVDFSNSVTDTRIITKCSTQTMDTSQPSAASGGCDVELTQAEWTLLVNANRGSSPITITVRGTTDGTCATKSMNSIKFSFASEDIHGAIYYWKSTITSNGTGGQIWEKSFGDTTPESQVTGVGGGALGSSCNGCHVLSRDGQRMVVYSDDDDSDDEYSDVTGSLIDMANKMAIGTAYAGRGTGQPPGFSTMSPTHAYYLTTDGLGTSPTNNFTLWNGNTGVQSSTITFGNSADRPTMPDWSPDGKTVVYDLPNAVATWDGIAGFGARLDDDHMFGGSLWTLPYNGNGAFGTPSVFLQSGGENNYYPSYSPDGQFIAFDRAPASTAVSSISGCLNAGSPGALCPNDSFSNPAARLMLTSATKGSTVIDLEQANGSTKASPVNLSNSWPRWSPFVQTYQGNKLLWIAFSSTRDYGLLVRNHLTGMYQCYPADAYQLPGGAHHSTFDAKCQQPKLWMAAINLSDVSGTDPSFPAFYLPFQDITTHNHTPQWTEQVVTQPPPDAGTVCIATGGNCINDPNACCAPSTCTGSGTCQPVIQ
jgi:hypothetical protein